MQRENTRELLRKKKCCTRLRSLATCLARFRLVITLQYVQSKSSFLIYICHVVQLCKQFLRMFSFKKDSSVRCCFQYMLLVFQFIRLPLKYVRNAVVCLSKVRFVSTFVYCGCTLCTRFFEVFDVMFNASLLTRQLRKQL